MIDVGISKVKNGKPFRPLSPRATVRVLRPRPAVSDLLRSLAEQRSNEGRMEDLLLGLERSIRAFEIRFGVKSELVHQAIDEGWLQETNEVCRWLLEYEAFKRATSAQAARSARLEL